jgi:hypothetical protein
MALEGAPAAAERPAILLATPCYGGQLTHLFVHSILGLLDYGGKHGLSFALLTAAYDSLVPRARNSLVSTFLGTSATHLMFIDADIGFRPEAVHRLVTFDEDFVCGMYPVKNLDWAKAASAQPATTEAELRESALHFVGEPCTGEAREARDGFVTGTYAGAGFMLLKRAVIERLVAAHPETRYRMAHTFPRPKSEVDHYNLFDCVVEPETGVYLSEDYTFCRRWRELGGKVWLDTESRLTHVGPYEFSGQPPAASLGAGWGKAPSGAQ